MRTRRPARRWRFALLAIVAVAIVRLVGWTLLQDPPQATTGLPQTDVPVNSSGFERALVTRAVDGDTLKVRRLGDGPAGPHGLGGGDGAEDTVRVIGANTPEVHGSLQCFGREAAAYAAQELAGREVLLERDVRVRDHSGRLLAYVWVGEPSPDVEAIRLRINARLIAEGYAEVLTIPPDVRHAELFARLAHHGLWGACAR